jgi:hypothetical protein
MEEKTTRRLMIGERWPAWFFMAAVVTVDHNVEVLCSDELAQAAFGLEKMDWEYPACWQRVQTSGANANVVMISGPMVLVEDLVKDKTFYVSRTLMSLELDCSQGLKKLQHLPFLWMRLKHTKVRGATRQQHGLEWEQLGK